jgi:predicted DNA-binding transcriptional regulator AlpA
MTDMLQTHLDDLPADGFLRLKPVMIVTGLRRSTLYDAIKRNHFPAPEKITSHAVGWRVRDVRAWLESPREWHNRSDRSEAKAPVSSER